MCLPCFDYDSNAFSPQTVMDLLPRGEEQARWVFKLGIGTEDGGFLFASLFEAHLRIRPPSLFVSLPELLDFTLFGLGPFLRKQLDG